MYAAYLSVVRMSMPRPLGYGQALEFVPCLIRYGVSFKGAPSGVVRDGEVVAFAHDVSLRGNEAVREPAEKGDSDDECTHGGSDGVVRGAVMACAVQGQGVVPCAGVIVRVHGVPPMGVGCC